MSVKNRVASLHVGDEMKVEISVSICPALATSSTLRRTTAPVVMHIPIVLPSLYSSTHSFPRTPCPHRCIHAQRVPTPHQLTLCYIRSAPRSTLTPALSAIMQEATRSFPSQSAAAQQSAAHTGVLANHHRCFISAHSFSGRGRLTEAMADAAHCVYSLTCGSASEVLCIVARGAEG